MTALEIVLVSVSGALVALIVALIIIVSVVNGYFTKKVVDYEVLNEFAPENPIVFLGDSLTDLFPVHEFLPDERIINRGISNETTFDVERRIDCVTALKPRTVFLLIGINDFLRLKKSTPKKVADRVVYLADILSKTCNDIRVISLFPVNKKKRGVMSRFYLRKVNNLMIAATNQLIKKGCLERGYSYLDFHSYLMDEHGDLNSDYTFEGLHLNLAGYKALTPYYKRELQSIEH
ncbi:MAG: hypothetical protein IJ811_00310 [Clostridia bacterium]|nr:hypothetical protein [Clostridia bacterium]